IASAPIIDRIRETWVLVENQDSLLTEALAAAVIRKRVHYRRLMLDELEEKRGIVQSIMGELIEHGRITGAIPKYGCVWFPRLNLDQSEDNQPFIDRLKELHVHVGLGRFFNAPKHIRVGFGGDKKKLAEALGILAEAIGEWPRTG